MRKEHFILVNKEKGPSFTAEFRTQTAQRERERERETSTNVNIFPFPLFVGSNGFPSSGIFAKADFTLNWSPRCIRITYTCKSRWPGHDFLAIVQLCTSESIISQLQYQLKHQLAMKNDTNQFITSSEATKKSHRWSEWFKCSLPDKAHSFVAFTIIIIKLAQCLRVQPCQV